MMTLCVLVGDERNLTDGASRRPRAAALETGYALAIILPRAGSYV